MSTPKPKKQPESYLEQQIVSLTEKKLGGEALKIEIKGRRGWPDRLLVLPNGRVWWIEVKDEKGRLSRQQELRIARLRELGHEVHVVWKLGEFRLLIEAMQLDQEARAKIEAYLSDLSGGGTTE